MSNSINREQLIDILNYIGSSRIVNKEGKDDVQFCCTIHGENNPSAGFSLEKQKFHCFSCHASGDITWLIYKSLPDQFSSLKEVDEWLKDRYGIDFKTFDSKIKSRIIRYEDVDDDVLMDEEEVEDSDELFDDLGDEDDEAIFDSDLADDNIDNDDDLI